MIQRRIGNELAMRLLQGEFGEGATVRVDAGRRWVRRLAPKLL